MKTIDQFVYTFSPENAPSVHAVPGEVLQFHTLDCFGGQIHSEDQLIFDLDLATSNPATGPVYIDGAEPGDVLAVDILDIAVKDAGFVCSIPGAGPLHEEAAVRTKIIPVQDKYAYFNDILFPIDPMVGVIGTAPADGSIACGYAGSHGGNIDSKLIRRGARVYLPVQVEGALLQLGDVHAAMGDGELCGSGMEISATVLVKCALIKDFMLHWPVTQTDTHWYVNATGRDYDEALMIACRELCRLMRPAYGWDSTDIFLYLSLQGDVGVNQGTRPVPDDMVNLRVGIPKIAGKEPLLG